ncbi:protein kinase domain-containing protein [Gordonia soli]|uniref:non-specific serine/threonine protein kinase n=1 Tax=Gordonia soli NBRC 108243 TaxID=1223545 RepID=M0QM17_9ACTN|nr:protein kinase [Gordonia soli]GAC69454.1 putative serine/threonine protein kinase/peptidyl-prolyl cis-trans isomerase [Gordonia soli NBRC 108243]
MTGQSSRTGTTLGPYRIGALLGRGGMGEVYEAYDSKKDRTVALKLLPPQLSDNDDFRERFLRESRTAARLSEPHIIPIHDFGEIDGLLYIDMRMVTGRDLRAELAKGPLAPSRAVQILTQIASALDSAHASGLVHRDVKPDNILIDENDFAYLVDFGIAHGATETRLTVAGSALGSLAYMAPERFGDQPAGPVSDVYSLACVLYETLTGAQPFATTSMQGLMTAHITAPPPTTGTAFDAVIARGMAKDPAHRFGSAREFAQAASVALSTPGPRPSQFPPGRPGSGAPVPPPYSGSGATIVGPAGHPGPSSSGPTSSGPTLPSPAVGRSPAAGSVSGPTVSGPATFGPTTSGPAGPTVSGPAVVPSGPVGPGTPPSYGHGGGFGTPPPPPGGPSGPQGLYGPQGWPQSPGGTGLPPQRSGRGKIIGAVAAVAVVVVILVVVGVVALGRSSGSDADGPPTTSAASSSAVAADTIACTYRDHDENGPTAPKPDGQQPDSGSVAATLATSQGDIGLTLDRTAAPCNVGAIVSLIKGGFYDNTTCHRLTATAGSSSLICGDPTGTQASSPGWASPDEPPKNLTPAPGAVDDKGRQGVLYPRGTIAVTNIDPTLRKNPEDSDGASTFFMVMKPITLVPYFTVVGTVDTAGLDVLDKIAAAGYTPAKPGVSYGRPNQSVVISTATVE